jgi:hypothetical protein
VQGLPYRCLITTLSPGAITLSKSPVRSRYQDGPIREVFARSSFLLWQVDPRNERPNQAQERFMLRALPPSTEKFTYVDIGRLAA